MNIRRCIYLLFLLFLYHSYMNMFARLSGASAILLRVYYGYLDYNTHNIGYGIVEYRAHQ